MSTGADCRFFEKERGSWFYRMQKWPYGATEDYAMEGPFSTFRDAHEHLGQHYANPGGYSVKALPGCPHDLIEETSYGVLCNRCGAAGIGEEKPASYDPVGAGGGHGRSDAPHGQGGPDE